MKRAASKAELPLMVLMRPPTAAWLSLLPAIAWSLQKTRGFPFPRSREVWLLNISSEFQQVDFALDWYFVNVQNGLGKTD